MEIIAHRGASGYAPENTMASFNKALEMGATAVEFDVQMTADGQLVVIHDDFLDRTTNGSGLVIRTDYDDISRLDAGSWFGPEFTGEKIPKLSEVLALLKDKVTIHLEIKKIALEARPTEEAVLQMVEDMGMADQVLFSSFDHECLRALANAGMKIGVIAIAGLYRPWNYIESFLGTAGSYNPSLQFISQELVKGCHDHGMKVYSFTVNERWIAEYFQSLGVDGIFSNYPDILSGQEVG